MEYPRVKILYDFRRSEKYIPLMNELNRQHITNYSLIDCIKDKTVVESISLSFKKIVQQARDNKEKYCLIFEDDVCFPNKKANLCLK